MFSIPIKNLSQISYCSKKINATTKCFRLKINKTNLTDTDKKNVIQTAVNASAVDTLNDD